MRAARILAVAVAGAAAAVTGLSFSAAVRTTGSGWTAYSPSSAESYPVFVGAPWWALALVVAGSVVTGAAGTLLVLRRRSSDPSGRG